MPIWVDFMEANRRFIDGEFVLVAQHKATIQYQHISGYEDHYIYIGEHKICVLEDYDRIAEKIDKAHESLIAQLECLIAKVGDHNGE